MNRILKLGLHRDSDVKTVQLLLNKHLKLSPPLVVDGAFGDNTYKAVKKYQVRMDLGVDGIVGPLTWGHLNAPKQKKAINPLRTRIIPLAKVKVPTVAATQVTPEVATPGRVKPGLVDPSIQTLKAEKVLDTQSVIKADEWMAIVDGEIGVREDSEPGKHNPRIIEFHSTTTLKATTDETPWCSAFANWVFKTAKFKGTGSAAARSWIGWGKKSALVKGAVVIIADKSEIARGSQSAHVGFLLSDNSKYFEILGGNQLNRVKTSYYYKSAWVLLDCRWPTDKQRIKETV